MSVSYFELPIGKPPFIFLSFYNCIVSAQALTPAKMQDVSRQELPRNAAVSVKGRNL